MNKQNRVAANLSVIQQMAGKFDRQAIADRLNLSVSTVVNIAHVHRISLGFKHRGWSQEDDGKLQHMAGVAVDWQTIGGLLNRTPDACRVRYGRLMREQLQD